MSRNISLNFRKALNDAVTGEVPIALVTVSHPDLSSPLRFSSDPTTLLSTEPLRYGTVSRGNTFEFMPFDWIAPEEGEDAPQSIDLELGIIDSEVRAALRSIAEPAVVTIEIVTASEPDHVQAVWPAFDLTDSSLSRDRIVISLTVDSLVSEPYPGHALTPAIAPVMF